MVSPSITVVMSGPPRARLSDAFKHSRVVRSHMAYDHEVTRTEYPRDTEFACHVCNRRFASEDALERHVNDAGLLY